MRKIKLFLVAIAALVTASAYAQNITVSGIVTDASNGEGVPFAAIQLKGTMTGASTDADGRYSISVPSNGTLVFSSVGYVTTEVAVAGSASHDVALAPDAEYLDDVIVIAYGTATKNSFTGSASMVKSETISKKLTTSVTSALAGTTPGVQVISASGDPTSSSPSIRIRGIGSMSASSAPLIVVDGVPFSGGISDINPNDVESLSVLKDASASAIYGHRGANGVVLITTKRGASGDAQVKFDARIGSNSRLIPNYDVITDPGQYYEQHYTKLYNSYFYSGHSAAESYAYADKYLLDEQNGGLGYLVYTVPSGEKLIGTNFKLNPNAKLGYSDGDFYYTPDDWYNEVFHNSIRQEYNVSISGAGERFNYYASGGYLDDKGIVSNSDYKRYTGRVNAEYQVKSWFKVNTNLAFTHSDSQTNDSNGSWGSSGNLFYITNNIAPIYPLYVRDASGKIMTENGRVVYDASGNTNFRRAAIVGNAVRDNEYDKAHGVSDTVTGKFGATFTPIRGLSLNANLGFLADNSRANYLYSIFGSGASTDGQAYVSHSRAFTVNQQYTADYKTDFGGTDHNFHILAGYEQYTSTSQSLYGQNDHLFNPLVSELSNADGTASKRLGSSSSQYMTQGFLSRLEYDYAGKYFLQGSLRYDASSNFAKGHRWGAFWSAGAAWLISAEDFMANVSWVDMLKLKASYGELGNDSIGSFPYTDHYTHSYNAATGEYSLALTYKGNENLTWEKKGSINIGVDFELFGGYLNGTLEYFDSKTSDLLYNKAVPLSAGNPTGQVPVNVGDIRNNGIELSLDGNIISTKNVRWNWNANFSSYKNTILALDPSVSEKGIIGGYYIREIGGSLYDAYMYKYAGVDKATGKALYWKHTDEKRDVNGVVSVPEKDELTTVFDEATQYRLGSTLPKLFGGFGTTLNAFGFDLSAQLSFQLGGQFYDGSYQALMHTQDNKGQALHKDILKAWTPQNTETDVPRWDGDTQVSQSALSRFLISSNYLSVDNVTLGYTIPQKWAKAIKLNSVRVYVAGENLFVLSARKGVDPRGSLGLGNYTSGSSLNSSNYSAMRTITGGITVTF